MATQRQALASTEIYEPRFFIFRHLRAPEPLAERERQAPSRTAVGGKKEDYRSKQCDHMTLLIKSLSSLLLLLLLTASQISLVSFSIHTTSTRSRSPDVPPPTCRRFPPFTLQLSITRHITRGFWSGCSG